jgi:hypothetical protein
VSALKAHLATGATTVCRAWAVTRRDGVVLGFTDHDRDLAFEGVVFRAASGLTASAVQQGTGLAVDNTEALGALSDAGLTEADILAGRYDGAEVRLWQVNWADVDQREMLFRGSVGEITRAGGAFRAELRGLTEMLNQPRGRVFQRDCSAVLGDGQCRVETGLPMFSVVWRCRVGRAGGCAATVGRGGVCAALVRVWAADDADGCGGRAGRHGEERPSGAGWSDSGTVAVVWCRGGRR